MTKWKMVLVALLLLAAGAVTATGLRERPAPAVAVETIRARRGPITRTVAAAGKIQAATTVKISSNLSGDLLELGVKEADPVTRGQVLGRIDRRRFEAAVKQATAARSAAQADVRLAEVELARATAERGRVASLTERGMASAAELERAQADVEGARARRDGAAQRQAQAAAAVEEADNNLTKTTLVSPIDGTVIELAREVGERVRGSDFSEDVVMVIAALATMEARIEVGEHEVVHLRPGQAAEVSIDALEGKVFPGRVLEIAQQGLVKNPGTEAEVTTFPVTVALDVRPAGVLPGMSAEVRIAAEKHDQAVLVPIQAVTVRPAAVLAGKPDAGAGAKAGTGEQAGAGEQAGPGEQAGTGGKAGPGEQAGTGGKAGPGEQAGTGSATARTGASAGPGSTPDTSAAARTTDTTAAAPPAHGAEAGTGRGEAPDEANGQKLLQAVFVVDPGGIAHLRRVRTGISTDSEIELLEGLEPGETVVQGPYRTLTKELKEGARTEPARAEGEE